jgi:hypothetical protein
MPNIFVSYHHQYDQAYKENLVAFGVANKIFADSSVDIGDIRDELSDQAIREKIRDEYLRDTTVTVLLAGVGTKGRKHVDWELYSSMFDGKVNKKSGLLVVTLPTINCGYYHVAHDNEKSAIYPECASWSNLDTRTSYEERYPYLPDRIIDNLLAGRGRISVVPWAKISNDAAKLKFLIDMTASDRFSAEYDLSRPMKRRDS